MHHIIPIFAILGGLLLLAIGWTFRQTLVARLKVDSTLQFQCSTGDSEVMVINLNRYRGEGSRELRARMDDAWGLIQDRRDFNHERWKKIQEESFREKAEAARNAEIAESVVSKLKQVPEEKA